MSLRKKVPPIPCWAPAAGIRNCGVKERVATSWPLAAAAMRRATMVTMAFRMQNLLLYARSEPAMNRYDRNLQIIYAATLMSTLIYAVVAWAATRLVTPGRLLNDELRDPVTIALYSGASGAFLAAVIVRAPQRLIVRWV